MSKYYKVINSNNHSMNGGIFDWTDYLPKEKRKGKWAPIIKNLKQCSNGYHVTKYWNMWIQNENDKVFECEVKGLKENNSVGVKDKYVCQSIRLIKQIKLNFDEHRNTGNWNTGYSNTGNWNTGYRNTGDRNTGDSNTGNWNTGNWNTGSLNTKEPEYYELFNKPIKKEIYKSIIFPAYFNFDLEGDYKKSWLKSFKKANKYEIKNTIELPNFDYKVFEDITGITKKIIQDKLKRTKTHNKEL